MQKQHLPNATHPEMAHVILFDKSTSRQNILKQVFQKWNVNCQCFSALEEFKQRVTEKYKPIVLLDGSFGTENVQKFLETWSNVASKSIVLSYSILKNFSTEVQFLR